VGTTSRSSWETNRPAVGKQRSKKAARSMWSSWGLVKTNSPATSPSAAARSWARKLRKKARTVSAFGGGNGPS
jgi:hypothetical protein